MANRVNPNISPQVNEGKADLTAGVLDARSRAASARAEYVQASARMKQIQLAKLEGTTAETDLLVNEYDRIISEIRAWMLILPRKIAVLVSPDDPFDTEKIIAKEADQILESLAESGAAWKKKIYKKS